MVPCKGQTGFSCHRKTGGKELPDATFEEAARLAAHYSTGRDQEKIEVDYVEKKQVKKGGRCKAWIRYLPHELLYGDFDGYFRHPDGGGLKTIECTLYEHFFSYGNEVSYTRTKTAAGLSRRRFCLRPLLKTGSAHARSPSALPQPQEHNRIFSCAI